MRSLSYWLRLCCWPLPFPLALLCLPLCMALFTILSIGLWPARRSRFKRPIRNSRCTPRPMRDGAFELPQAPIGVYRLTVVAPGFDPVNQTLTVASGTNPVLHIPLAVGGATQSVVVNGSASSADTVTPTTLITRAMIDKTPGASRTLGMEMITDFVPGAYMTHDMLHIRGGHQTSWLIDGVAIPNTKISSNVGPQIDPKDIDSLETQRGSYAADVGDRTVRRVRRAAAQRLRARPRGRVADIGGEPLYGRGRSSRWATTRRRPHGMRA